MNVVVGTAGHIDHGKTSLLRALTGIDADRLPEEQRRGMTIDVGYAHMTLASGGEIDFVDVPGHDRLIGNMLVGAGEIDAAMLVVAADDGPRAQTMEHLGLLHALRIDLGLVVVTKIDLVSPERRAEVVALVQQLVDGTSLVGAPVVLASSMSLEGLDAVRAALAVVQDAVLSRPAVGRGPARLAVDRVFSVRGRGVVVTGSLRGGSLARGDVLRVEPAGTEVRVRELEVHGQAVERLDGGGRLALNLAGPDVDTLQRGDVLTAGPAVERTDRILVALAQSRAGPARHALRVRLHLGTEQVDGTLDLGRRAAIGTPDGGTTAIIRLERPIAAAFGDRFVLRRPSPGETLAGGRIIDPHPPRGISRRRMDGESLAGLATAERGSDAELRALVTIHGALPASRSVAWAAAYGGRAADLGPARMALADDVTAALEAAAIDLVRETAGVRLAELREALIVTARRRVAIERTAAGSVVDRLLDTLLAQGRLVRDGEHMVPQGAAAGPGPDILAAMDRLVSALAVPAPPSLREAAAATHCPIEGIRALEAAGRIVRVEDDLAWEGGILRGFVALALRLASVGPVSPAAFRDATGTSRRYALAILEDLDRQAILRRTPAGHVPGPRAASAVAALTAP